MPTYHFRVQADDICDSQSAEFDNQADAWKEMKRVCADFVGGNCRKLSENAEWQMELVDSSKEPVFRIRLVAETLK